MYAKEGMLVVCEDDESHRNDCWSVWREEKDTRRYGVNKQQDVYLTMDAQCRFVAGKQGIDQNREARVIPCG